MHAPRLLAFGDPLRRPVRIRPGRSPLFSAAARWALSAPQCSPTCEGHPSLHAGPSPGAEARPPAPRSQGVCCPRKEERARAGVWLRRGTGSGGPGFLLAFRWAPSTPTGAELRSWRFPRSMLSLHSDKGSACLRPPLCPLSAVPGHPPSAVRITVSSPTGERHITPLGRPRPSWGPRSSSHPPGGCGNLSVPQGLSGEGAKNYCHFTASS